MSENALFRTALTKAMGLCARREYCVSDICAKLNSWSLGDNETEKILKILLKENFINESGLQGVS